MGNYHNRIMNIQSDVEDQDAGERIIYKTGHRDARHTAAEIALEAEREIEEIKEILWYTDGMLKDMELDSLADYILKSLRGELNK